MKCYAQQSESVLRRPIESGLAALVRVMQQLDWLTTPPDRHHQGIGHELRGHARLHRPANDATRVQVEHHGHVQPAFGSPEWSERLGVVELFPSLSSPNRTCTSQRIRLSIQVLLKAKATSA